MCLAIPKFITLISKATSQTLLDLSEAIAQIKLVCGFVLDESKFSSSFFCYLPSLAFSHKDITYGSFDLSGDWKDFDTIFVFESKSQKYYSAFFVQHSEVTNTNKKFNKYYLYAKFATFISFFHTKGMNFIFRLNFNKHANRIIPQQILLCVVWVMFAESSTHNSEKRERCTIKYMTCPSFSP